MKIFERFLRFGANLSLSLRNLLKKKKKKHLKHTILHAAASDAASVSSSRTPSVEDYIRPKRRYITSIKDPYVSNANS